MTELQVPPLLGGRYALGTVLGTGATSRVHRAYDQVLAREVAVKVFRQDAATHDAARVQTEVRTMASLNHPHLVAVHDAVARDDEDGQTLSYLVMELVEGPTLAARLASGPVPADQVAQIGSHLAAALAYVHQRGIVHRDVKPANVLLGTDGRTRLADFGIVRLIDQAGQTGTGLTVGTAPYLSPEQVRGRPVGPPADVYALGLVLLECLTGRREYDGGPVECALARLTRPPTVPTTLPLPWPALLAAMTADEADRRPSAGRVAQALGAAAPVLPPRRGARTIQPDAQEATSALLLPRARTEQPPRARRRGLRPRPATGSDGGARRTITRWVCATALLTALSLAVAVAATTDSVGPPTRPTVPAGAGPTSP